MYRRLMTAVSACALLVGSVQAQEAVSGDEAMALIDCDDPIHAQANQCLGLPEFDQDITNFAPVISPLIGAAAVAVLGAGGDGGGTTSTVSTTE